MIPNKLQIRYLSYLGLKSPEAGYWISKGLTYTLKEPCWKPKCPKKVKEKKKKMFIGFGKYVCVFVG